MTGLEFKMNTHVYFVLLFLPCLFGNRASSIDWNVTTTKPTCPTGKTSCLCQNGRDGRDGRDGITMQGPAGRDGLNGQDGRDCVECGRGPKGDPGSIGPAGTQGPPGTPGAPGRHGQDGAKGEKGPKGDTGADGAKGDKGDKGDKGLCDITLLAQLQESIKKLRIEVEELKASAGRSRGEVSRVYTEVGDLQREMVQLQNDTVKLGPNKKIKQSLLPGGYSDFSVVDLQWQSLHMAAAASCRAVTGTGGSGPKPNRLFPRVANRSCDYVCKLTPYKECDAELTIFGNMKVAKSSTDEIGMYYNYGCEVIGGKPAPGFEPNVKPEQILKSGLYISFCCCR